MRLIIWCGFFAFVLSGCVAPAAQEHYDLYKKSMAENAEATRKCIECIKAKDFVCAQFWNERAQAVEASGWAHYNAGREIQREQAGALG